MKKLFSLAALAALITLATLSGCKKENPTFTGDFTKLSVELIESTMGVDSILVADKLLKDGFVYDGQYGGEYKNNSYGLTYRMVCDAGKIIQFMGYVDSKLCATDNIALFKQENDKMISRRCACFKGFIYDFTTSPVSNTCTKNQQEMKTYIENMEFVQRMAFSNYNNGKLEFMLDASQNDFDIVVEMKNDKLKDSDTIYGTAESSCIQ